MLQVLARVTFLVPHINGAVFLSGLAVCKMFNKETTSIGFLGWDKSSKSSLHHCKFT